MGYEARWNDSKNICCSADTIEEVLGCICSMTAGKGKVFIYKFSKDNKPFELVKVLTITN